MAHRNRPQMGGHPSTCSGAIAVSPSSLGPQYMRGAPRSAASAPEAQNMQRLRRKELKRMLGDAPGKMFTRIIRAILKTPGARRITAADAHKVTQDVFPGYSVQEARRTLRTNTDIFVAWYATDTQMSEQEARIYVQLFIDAQIGQMADMK